MGLRATGVPVEEQSSRQFAEHRRSGNIHLLNTIVQLKHAQR
jgi:hypothetical protein